MLEVAMKTTIKTLYEQGYNKTQIAKMLSIDRKTVRKILKGFDEEKDGGVEKKPCSSQFNPYREYILIQLSKGLSITRIYQDLVREQGITGSYSALKDFVRKNRPVTRKTYMVLHSLPGEEAQVDFGYIGTLKVNGKPRKAWVFVMTLSYSRYMYAEIALDQSVSTFINCHVNGFRYFGGVPETVKIDNLKAAILEADFYEPLTQRTYAAFAAHYGFLPNPCRVYTPTDKGKVESNVKYIKDNCFKAREFKDMDEARKFLSDWLENISNVRKHGTTGKVPKEVYHGAEIGKLKEIPRDEFLFSKSAKAIVYANCHISYGANYYSAPYGYVGSEVDVIEVNNMLKIYYKGKEIALHVLAGNTKGAYVTNNDHYSHTKNITREEILSSYQEKMSEIGSGAAEFFRMYLDGKDRTVYDRTIAGVLSLLKRYDRETIDKACRRASHFGNISYRAVKKICETGIENLPLTETKETPESSSGGNVRSLSEYRQMTCLGVISHE